MSPSRQLAARAGRVATRHWRAALAVVLAVLGAGSGLAVVTRHHAVRQAVGCTVAAVDGSRRYRFTAVQAQNASVIAAVGAKAGLADHATTVALATALVESRLRNLPYGDRDSVGLFQQRPSQGWGSRVQLLDPSFAATAFYRRLAAVPGWEAMAVTVAAQHVQRSAAPDAYGRWEAQARALARVLTGEIPVGLSCHLDGFDGPPPAPGALLAAAASEFGSARIGPTLDMKGGWATAIWTVAHAFKYHLTSVSFGGWRWSATAGRWTHDATAGSSVVVASAP